MLHFIENFWNVKEYPSNFVIVIKADNRCETHEPYFSLSAITPKIVVLALKKCALRKFLGKFYHLRCQKKLTHPRPLNTLIGLILQGCIK